MSRLFNLGAVIALAVTLAGCAGAYRTHYDDRLDPAVTRAWRVADVRVSVPEELTVSEAPSLVPNADIVWREGPKDGDRKAQVAEILRDAIRRGASGLRGSRAVVLQAQVTRFHALTFEAETRLSNSGVHNVHFFVTVVDARSGAVLHGPVLIEADVPAFSGSEAVRRRELGETQRSVITNHVAATIAGWLGIAADNRGSFSRLGD